jgi:hypothetical protein
MSPLRGWILGLRISHVSKGARRGAPGCGALLSDCRAGSAEIFVGSGGLREPLRCLRMTIEVVVSYPLQRAQKVEHLPLSSAPRCRAFARISHVSKGARRGAPGCGASLSDCRARSAEIFVGSGGLREPLCCLRMTIEVVVSYPLQRAQKVEHPNYRVPRAAELLRGYPTSRRARDVGHPAIPIRARDVGHPAVPELSI